MSNSANLNAFSRDLLRYQQATGKATNEVLAAKALDFSIKYSKEMRRLAPTPDEIENEIKRAGYAIRVRKRVVKALGGSLTGKTRRRVRGKVLRNKRAVAVAREVGIRRSSSTFLSRSVARWRSSQNSNIPEGQRTFGTAHTRRRTSQIGKTTGTFTKRKDQVRVTSSAFAAGIVDRAKGNIAERVKRQVSADINRFLSRRVGREFSKNIRRSYK